MNQNTNKNAMNKFIISLFAVLLVAGTSFVQAKKNPSIEVLSYNIRYDNAGDGHNQWKNRKDYAADLIKFYNADIIGTQEVLSNQLTDLVDRLPGYAYVGVGREDGKMKGEACAIFFKKDRFDVIDSGNFWLAEEINAVGKKGWDAACERIATWVVFKDKESGKRFLFLNTHLDHMGKVARHEGAMLILKEVDILAKGLPAIVTGDFNATPDDDPIRVLTNPDDARRLIHTRAVANIKYGPEGTFHDFGRVPVGERQFIDYIFVKGDIKTLRHGVLTDSNLPLYPSDHYPVLATLIIK